MDHAAWLAQDDGEESQKAYAHFMSVDPDQRDFLGPKETDHDPVTGREATYRRALIGMVRGAKRENMKEVKVYLAFDGEPTWPHTRLDAGKPLQGWYQGADTHKPGGRTRPCYTEAVLTEPYGGWCHVGCSFCYLNSGFRGYRGSGLVTVPINYGAHVRKQLSSMRKSAAGYFSSFTDPFLPLETYYHNTQEGATEFVKLGLPIFFLSRLSYPGWAFDLLRQSKYSYAQKSINTCDPDDWKKLSPNALPLGDHLDEIRALKAAGIYVSIQVNPIIAGITSVDEIVQLIYMLKDAGADHCIFKYVEANHPWAPAMVERLGRRFGDNRVTAFRDLFTENSCGGQKTINEDYRRAAFDRYKAECDKLGLTMSLCYEYTSRPDGLWKSMGGEYLTSDQCHGHRVPMFERQSTVGSSGKPMMFREVSECPPSGCLTCASGSETGEPACGSALMGLAKAMRASDYKTPVRSR